MPYHDLVRLTPEKRLTLDALAQATSRNDNLIRAILHLQSPVEAMEAQLRGSTAVKREAVGVNEEAVGRTLGELGVCSYRALADVSDQEKLDTGDAPDDERLETAAQVSPSLEDVDATRRAAGTDQRAHEMLTQEIAKVYASGQGKVLSPADRQGLAQSSVRMLELTLQNLRSSLRANCDAISTVGDQGSDDTVGRRPHETSLAAMLRRAAIREKIRNGESVELVPGLFVPALNGLSEDLLRRMTIAARLDVVEEHNRAKAWQATVATQRHKLDHAANVINRLQRDCDCAAETVEKAHVINEELRRQLSSCQEENAELRAQLKLKQIGNTLGSTVRCSR